MVNTAATQTGSSAWVPALPAQHGTILNYMRFPDDGVDVIQMTLDWTSPLEREPFEAAWHAAVRRHPVLRTAFRLDADGLVQIVDPDASMDIRWRDLPSQLGTGPDQPFESFLREDRRERFDLARGPLVRLTIVRRIGSGTPASDAPAYRAVMTFHHALLDGQSMRLLVDEISAAYAASRDGRASAAAGGQLSTSPDPPSSKFHEYVRWWHTTDTSASEQFWTSHLAGTVLPRPLPGYLGAPTPGVAEPMTAETVLSREDSDLIRQVAGAAAGGPGQSSTAWLNSSTMVTAAWALLRARYGGVTDVVLAVTRSCRRDSIPGAETIVGPLINTVPLRVRLDDEWPVRDLLTTVNDGIHQIRQHQRTSMGSALSWAGLPADTALVDSLVMFDRLRLASGLHGGDAAPSAVRVDRLGSFPLTVLAYDEPRIHLSLIWDRRRFADGSAQRILDQLRATLIEFASSLSTPLADLDLGRAAESEILAEWNTTRASYPADAAIPALFAAQVARDPDATALVSSTGAMSYGELDRRSDALAWLLRRRGVVADMPVGVAMPRGTDLIVALLAVLKAGGAYLPIDAGSPPSRVAAMLAAASTRLVLVTPDTATTIPDLPGLDLIRIDEEFSRGLNTDPPPSISHPLTLAYISFTSGSTGVPKGVAVPHRAVIRLISDPTFASLGPGERLLHLAPVAFDASTLEIWGALLTGATVVVAPSGPLGLSDVASLLRTAQVTVAWLTAGLFHQLVETDIDAIADVPVVLAGGDVLNPDMVRAVLKARRGRPLVNGYGPTENTTFTACHVMTDPSQVGPAVPIGRPIQHTTVHVLDQRGRPAPIGVTGELYTGGDGLARGYAGNAAATARAFVPDPGGNGARLYRTGDLARWRADGTLEFVGRADDQIKIRGFRVEPGEVEAVLRAHTGVREAVVLVAGEGAQRHLIGYVTPADGVDAGTLRPSMLRDFVAQRLPDYLVPTGFKALDRLPLNANGKVDRAALPAPEREIRGPASSPRGPTEERLADMWRILLPTADSRLSVGREDSFFALGGNSLLAARLMFRIHEEFDVEVGLAAFYEAPTLAASAAAIDAARPGDHVAVPAPRSAAAPSSIGRRDRSAYRVAASRSTPHQTAPDQPALDQPASRDRTGALAPHLVRLVDDWALWRTVCLRAAGFPISLLSALGDTELARAADATLATGGPGRSDAAAAGPGKSNTADAYAAEFAAAVRRLSAALHEAARLPALREAVAWQNRHALTTGIDVLVRRGPEPGKRNAQRRQHEALVASYLQRYCAKNDTIGFFGPVSWSRIDDGPGIRITHAAPEPSIAARVTYLEGWAVRAIMAAHAAALRPWLVPRRMPFVGVDDTLLRLPLAPAVPLTPTDAAVMRACDGVRDANEVAAVVLADHSAGLSDVADVFAVLGRLTDSHRVAWQIDVAPQDLWPERSMRALLSRVTDDSVRGPAEQALSELTAGRDELASAAGDAERVAAAMAHLEEKFTRLAGIPATRRAGETYAGRTLAYEECLRGDTIRLGADALDGMRAALGLVLDGARWFTATCGALYARLFEEAYRQRAAELGTGTVPFADFWLIVNDALFDERGRRIEPVVRELRERWSAILDLPPGTRRIQLRSADLRERVTSAFRAQPLPWPMAVHHSPDLMIAGADAAAAGPGQSNTAAAGPGGRLTWVLGEVHPGIVTTRYATWLEFHDAPATVAAAMRHDLRGPTVWVAETAEKGGTNTRLSNVLLSAGDVRLVFAHDSCGYDPAATVTVGDCDLVSSPAGLMVRRRDGTFERGLMEVVSDLLSAVISHCYDLVPSGAHAPRVTIDDLVVSRERWTLTASDPAFADTADESVRYLRARAWAASLGLPRHVFMRFTGERKPIYADLTSIASIDLISRALRRCRQHVGPDATVTVTEMLPSPDQAWLTDAQGLRYTAELRMVAVDQAASTQQGGG